MIPGYVEPITLWKLPAKRGPHTPLVVLFHGRGADENDLFPLTNRLPKSFTYVSVRGPVAAEGGFTWFESRGVAQPIAKSLHASVAALRRWLDGPHVSAGRARVFVLGFSAGMMMAGALILDDPQRFAGAILLSGALPLGSVAAETGRLAGLPVLYARGTHDTVIPAPLVARTTAYLTERSAAYLVRREYAHAHAISTREIDDIGGWLAERA